MEYVKVLSRVTKDIYLFGEAPVKHKHVRNLCCLDAKKIVISPAYM